MPTLVLFYVVYRVGLVESRLRVLVDILDKQPAIEMVHAWPKSISERSVSKTHHLVN